MTLGALLRLSVLGLVMLAATGCSFLIDPNNELLGGGVSIVDDAGADGTIEPPPVPGDPDASVPPTPGTPDAAPPPGPDTYQPANAEEDIWDDEADDLVIGAEELRFNTSDCRATAVRSERLEQTSGDDEEFCAIFVRNFRIGEEGSLRIGGDIPFAIFATGNVDIQGELDVSALGLNSGPGGGEGGPWNEQIRGDGPGGGGGGEHEGTYDDGGGGGASNCGRGGPGGAGGTAAGGMPGPVQILDGLEPLRGGSGGGRGRGVIRMVRGETVGNAGRGGAGGGAIQISALGTIRVTGRILAGGGGGEEGSANFGNQNWGSGGGGGSGGAVLLQAPSILLNAGEVNVGGGAGGGSSSNFRPGASGEDGRDSIAAARGGEAADEAYGAAGGGGSGGEEAVGGARGNANTREGANGGGGGGGSGCIVLRSDDLQVTDAFTFSPFASEVRQELSLD